MKLLAALALPALIVLGFAYFGTQLVGDSAPPARQHARAIVWGDRVFVSRAQLAGWLRAHGVGYLVWARRHPVRAGLEPPRPAAADRPVQALDESGTVRLTGATALLAAALLLVFRRRRRARLLRWAGEAGRATSSHAGAAVLVAWQGRRELAWYVGGALLVAGGALVVAWS